VYTKESQVTIGYSTVHHEKVFNKHLMTDPKGSREFCFPETVDVPRGEAKWNIEVEGKQNSVFPMGPVINCFVILPNSKIEKNLPRNRLLDSS